MTARAAIYARFSSDLQRDRSIDDQVALCREYAARHGYIIVSIFVDRAKTGASMLLRPGIQDLLQAARSGGFEFVIAESMSRLGRDEEDRAAIRKRLTHWDIQIVTPADGLVSRLTDGIKAVMDAHQLEDLKLMIRRGMAGVIRDGRHAGGSIYGYRSIPGRPGELEIVPEEAAVVRRIFAEYVDGRAPRAIAAALNDENVSAPRAGYWRASTVNGHVQRRTGILQNELYCGRLIWNRARRVRDPDTGQRIWRYRPETEWQRAEAQHLRIVDDDLFEQAQRVRASRSRETRGWRLRPKRILSGLLRCGACGAGMSKKDVDHGRPRIVCTRMLDTGTCDNRRRYYVDEIERIVVGGLRDELGTREAIAYFVRCYNDERRRLFSGSADRRASLAHDLAGIDRHVQRAVKAIIEGRITEAEAEAHLPELRKRRAMLAQELAGIESPPVVVELPGLAVDRYLRGLQRLEEVLNADLAAGDDGAAKVLRQMVETVTIMPAPSGQTPGIVVKGELGSILGLESAAGRFPVGGSSGAG